jgi:hypothetical protein
MRRRKEGEGGSGKTTRREGREKEGQGTGRGIEGYSSKSNSLDLERFLSAQED